MAMLPMAGVMGSCVGCMTIVEKIAKADPTCMDLMTFSTFLFIATEGLIMHSKFFSVKNQILLQAYLKVASIFFIVNVVNNMALGYHVPVPLHIIFRSGSLLASLLLGVFVLKRQYSLQKYMILFNVTLYFSVVAVSIGIVICTLATDSKSQHATETDHGWTFFIGICMLFFALIMSAYLGITQERLYSQYGKHPREALFYIHLIGLPGFAFLYNSISASATSFSASSPVNVPLVGDVPHMWLWLLASNVAQYMCIRCVYSLTSECSALTVTLVVTLRKFASLVISIYVFDNPFTTMHWVGASLVFVGSLAFAELNKMKKSQPTNGIKKTN